MVGHGGIVAFDDRTDMRDVAAPPAALRRARELRQVLPVPDRPAARATSMFAADAARRPRAARGAARDARARQPVRARRRHAGADPQPARALPRRAGAGVMRVDDRRHRRSRSRTGTTVLEAIRAAGARRADALLRRAPGPVRRLPRLPRRRRGRARADPRVHDAVPRRHGDRHPGRDARRVAAAVVELVLSELPEPPAAHTELAEVAGELGVALGRAALARRRPTRPSTTAATRTSPSSTSSASRAGAACAPATRSRARSR